VHGGGFVAGDKKELANYCRVLASKGYIVAAPNYARPPRARYPGPLNQVNAALAFLIRNADRYDIDTANLFLAGDSGGAHIAAQLACAVTNKAYADVLHIAPAIYPARLKGVLLYCGPYNTALVNFDSKFGGFLRTVMWSYFGQKDFANAPGFDSFSVTNYVSGAFPSTFISVGNDDPLGPHSHELAARLGSRGVKVDSLFFPAGYSPGLAHEYQFDLDLQAAKEALDRSTRFLQINTIQ